MRNLHSAQFPCRALDGKGWELELSSLIEVKNIELVRFSEGWGVFNGRKRYWASDEEKERIKSRFPSSREFDGGINGKTWHSYCPLDLEIEITTRCNALCVHCFNDCCSSGEDAPLDKLTEVIRDFRRSGGQRLLLTGGEPLLHPQLSEILEYAKSEGINNYNLVTNGSRINKQKADLIARYFDFINISLHGPTADIHDKITRLEGSYDKAVKGIRYLKERNVDVLIYFTIMKENIESIPQMFDFVKEMDCGGIRLKPINPDGRARGREEISREGKRVLAKYVWKLSEVKGVRLLNSELHQENSDNIRTKFYGCDALRTLLYVSANGDIHSCNLMFEEKLGNLNDTPLQDFWMSDVARNYRDKIDNTAISCESCGGLCRRNGGLAEKCQ